MNYKELEDWCADARRSVEREMDRLQEQQLAMGNHLRVLEAAGELLAEIDRQKDELEQKQSEIDMLSEQLERKELQTPSLYPRKHRELLRAIVAVKTGISFYKVDLKALDKAYSIAFPHSTPINVNKKKRS